MILVETRFDLKLFSLKSRSAGSSGCFSK